MTTDDRHLTERLQDAYRIEMTDDVHRRQLDTITAALTAPPVVPVAPAPAALRLRRRFAAIVAAVTVLSPAAVAVAAESSLPGDTLYPVKQVTEEIRSMVDPTVTARHRLEEADQMHAAGFPTAVVQDVLSDADEAITIAGDPVDLRARWMDTSTRMDVDHRDGEMAVTPRVDDVAPPVTDPSTSPMPGATSGHDDDRMAGDTPRDSGAPAEGSGTVHDTPGMSGRSDGTVHDNAPPATIPDTGTSDMGAGHDNAPPATIPDTGTSDMGTGHDTSGTTRDGSGMSWDQGAVTDQESGTSHDAPSMGTTSDAGAMDGAGSGSGG